MSQVHQTPRQDSPHPSSRATRQRHSPVHLGLYECPQNRHQLLVLQVVCALDGHVQDVDWLFFEVLGGKTQRWAMEGPGAPPAPPRLAPCSDTHLAVFVTVQGSAGLAEKGAVPGHVGEAGDDFIKVPGGVGQRAGLRGCSPTRT